MADQNIPEGPAVKLMQTLHSEEAFTVDKWFLRQQTYLLKTLEGLEQEEFQKAVSIYSCEKRIVLIGTASDAPPAALVDALVVTVFEQMREASVENLSHLYHKKKICTKLVNFQRAITRPSPLSCESGIARQPTATAKASVSVRRIRSGMSAEKTSGIKKLNKNKSIPNSMPPRISALLIRLPPLT